MKLRAALSIAVFLLGFASAWMLRPLAIPQEQPESEQVAASRSISKRAAAQAHAPSSGRYQNHLEIIEIAAAKSDEKSLSDALQYIPSSDIPSLLEAWQKRAGLSGLSDAQKSLAQKLVAHWYEKDAAGAIAWLETLEPEADKRMFQDGILLFEAERDWDRTLALLKQFQEDSMLSFFPHVLRKKMNDCDAETVGKILRDFPQGFFLQPLKIDFKEGFDFAELGRILANDHGDNEVFLCYSPTNFIEEWANKDVYAAFDWGVKNIFLSGYDMDTVFFKLTNEVGCEEANNILIKSLANETTLRDKYLCASFCLRDLASHEQIANFVEKLPGKRIDHLEELAKHAKQAVGYEGFGHDEFKRKLLTVMTAEERAILIPKTYALKRSVDRDLITQTLQELGHSPEEIKDMMSAQ